MTTSEGPNVYGWGKTGGERGGGGGGGERREQSDA